MSGTATNLDDYEAITRVIQYYLDGAKSGKGSDMKPAFHEDATIFGYVGPDLFAGPIQSLFDWNDKNGPANGIKSRISEIDVVGTITNVRLEIDNWTGSRFTDMFTLLSKTEVEDHEQGLSPPRLILPLALLPTPALRLARPAGSTRVGQQQLFPCPAITIVGVLVLPEVIVGITEATISRSLSRPIIRKRESTTADGSDLSPIFAVHRMENCGSNIGGSPATNGGDYGHRLYADENATRYSAQRTRFCSAFPCSDRRKGKSHC